MPSSGSDFKGLMRTAMKRDNPVMIFTHGLLYGIESDVPEGDYRDPVRQGRDQAHGQGCDGGGDLAHRIGRAARPPTRSPRTESRSR